MSLKEHQQSFENVYSTHPLFSAISNREVDEYGLVYKSTIHKRYWWWTFENIYTMLNLHDNDRVLDIGIGFGLDERIIKSRLPTVDLYGIDISPSMIAGSLLNETPAALAVAAAEELPFASNTFTRVVSREVIEHVLDPLLVLDQIKRTTTYRARIVITTPNANSLALSHLLQKIHIGALVFRQHQHKDEHRTPRELENLFVSSGFQVQERFFDCAGYFWLSSLFRTPLAPLALAFARLSRVLEGHDQLSELFCDQVKYVLLCNTAKIEEKQALRVWACPVCGGELTFQVESCECFSCHTIYPLLEGKAPIFTGHEQAGVTSTLSNAEVKKPNMIIRMVIVIAYSLVYGFVFVIAIGLAWLLRAFGRSSKPGLKSS